MQTGWGNRRCLFKMLQSPPLIATAAPPHAEERGEHSPGPLKYVVYQISQINCMRKGGDHQALPGDGVSFKDAVGMIITF